MQFYFALTFTWAALQDVNCFQMQSYKPIRDKKGKWKNINDMEKYTWY